MALRIHFDDCAEDNGAIRFIAGSHRHGILEPARISAARTGNPAVTCAAKRGDVIAMCPLIIHSSPAAANPNHRRVLHIEYAAVDLPGGLKWAEASGLDGVELIMAIEEEFGVDIPNEAAERMVRVGDTYEYLKDRLNSSPSQHCLSQRIFYKLRRALLKNYVVKRRDITPDTQLSAVIEPEELDAGSALCPFIQNQ